MLQLLHANLMLPGYKAKWHLSPEEQEALGSALQVCKAFLKTWTFEVLKEVNHRSEKFSQINNEVTSSLSNFQR